MTINVNKVKIIVIIPIESVEEVRDAICEASAGIIENYTHCSMSTKCIGIFNYFDLVTARYTIIDPQQIYKTLNKGGQLVIRGVDKLDCWSLKRMFKRGQAYHDIKPISLIDYEAIMDAGFKEVELIPLHVIEYYKTKKDLYALLVKTPILDDFSEKSFNEYERRTIEKEMFEKYVKQNTTEKGIKLIRRYYGIIGKK